MSKAAKDKFDISCPRVDFEHKPSEVDDPQVICQGKIVILNREYICGLEHGPRDVGVEIPIGFCNQCFDSREIVNLVMSKIKETSLSSAGHILNKEMLEPNYDWRARDSRNGEVLGHLAKVKHTITCMNADSALAHGDENLGETHPIIVRGLFRMVASDFTTWVDRMPYSYDGEFDACLHCLEFQLNLIRSMAIERFYNFIIGQDLNENPDKELPMSWVAAMAGKIKQRV